MVNQYAQWCVFRAAREQGVIVLLDGQGADELIAGYAQMRGFGLRSLGPRAMVRAFRREPEVRSGLRLALARDVMPRWLEVRLRRRDSNPYAAPSLAGLAAARLTHEPAWMRGAGHLGRELRRQAFAGSLPELLRYGDRNSMAHSCEVRLPFLDRRVAELALSLPADALFRDGFTKAVLRDAVRDIVPAVVLDRRDKVGFEPPQSLWLASENGRAWVADVLLDPAARRRGHYDVDAIEDDLAGRSWRDPAGLWRALNLELWLRAFGPPSQTTPGDR